jgi:hypothetical protein
VFIDEYYSHEIDGKPHDKYRRRPAFIDSNGHENSVLEYGENSGKITHRFKSKDRLVFNIPKEDRKEHGFALFIDKTSITEIFYLEKYSDQFFEVLVKIHGIFHNNPVDELHVPGHICNPTKPGCQI